MKRAVGYIRASTGEQKLGPEDQRRKLQAWCKQHGARLDAVFEDLGVSGGAPLEKRPGLMGALDRLRERRADILLVAKRDRLSRDLMASLMVQRLVERQKSEVVATDGGGNGTGPEAELMRGILDLFAQYERAIIRSRIRAALAVKKSRGEKTGGDLPFGYRLARDGVSLAKNPKEQRVIRLVKALREQGVSLRRIVDRLNKDRVPARGGRWHLTSLHRLLKREAEMAA